MSDLRAIDADVTTLEVDAITNAANGYLRHGAGVAGAIAKAGGEAFARENDAVQFSGLLPISPGRTAVTGGGDMPCRWVIHAVTMAEPGGQTEPDVAYRATVASLERAEELEAESLALVAFGTGIGGLPIHVCAAVQVHAVHRFRRLHGRAHLEVIFALRGEDAVNAYVQAVKAERG